MGSLSGAVAPDAFSQKRRGLASAVRLKACPGGSKHVPPGRSSSFVGCLCEFGVLLVGAVLIRALLFGRYSKAP